LNAVKPKKFIKFRAFTLIPQPLLPREKGSKSPSLVGEGFRERARSVYGKIKSNLYGRINS
jgi:hypothetical protein